MSLSNSVSRLAEYYKRNGLRATMRRAGVAAKRALFAGRMVVLYCDLDEGRLPPLKVPKSMQVERLRALADISAEHFEAITSFWNPKLANRNILERFEKGASLWLVECEGRLAGYGWTLQGQPISPYYFPLGPDDVQLFDFYVFPRFRGRALHWLLTSYILHTLTAEGRSRAFADTGEWNQAQLASFKMTPFRIMGWVRTYKIFGQMLTCWAQGASTDREQMRPARGDKAMKMLRSNE